MNKTRSILMVVLILCLAFSLLGSDDCSSGSEAEKKDRLSVDLQQQKYQRDQPVPFFEYSIPRDVFIQIYNVVCTRAHVTYSVIETITGVTKFDGPSLGFGIPADTQLTNPLQPATGYHDSAVIEQAEPNGLFSSKNTDGTWVLFIQEDGSVTPVYTEHKVTTFPFVVKKVGEKWERADKKPVAFQIDLKRIQEEVKKIHGEYIKPPQTTNP